MRGKKPIQPGAVKANLGLIVRSALSIALSGGIAYHIGSGQILSLLKAVHWQVIALTVIVLASSVLIVTPRWAVIISALGFRIGWTALAASVFLGFLFNQLLPTAVGGDAIRAWRAHQLGAPLETSIHSVILDRVSGLIVVLLGVVALLPLDRKSVV